MRMPHVNNTLLANLTRGMAAGLVATGAMSVVLAAAHKVGAIGRQPPEIIVDSFLPQLPVDKKRMLALIAHFGYGSTAAAAYAAALPTLFRGVTSGTVYGAAVWLAGYEGWLPMMGILPPAHRDDRRRVGTMVAGHLVFGAALGLILRRRRG